MQGELPQKETLAASTTDSAEKTDKVQATPPATTSSPKGTPSSHPLTLEDLAKLGAASVVLCYGVGLLIVNAFLLPYGVTDFNLFRARFIFAGLLVLIVMGIATICPSIFITFIHTFRRRPKWPTITEGSTSKKEKISKTEVYITWNYLIVAGMLLIVPYFIFRYPLNQTPAASVEGYFISAVCGGCILLAWYQFSITRRGKPPLKFGSKRVRRKRTRRYKVPPAWTMYGLIGFFFIPYVFWTISYFAQQVFPTVPTQMGGAQAQQVKLLISPDSVAGLQKLGIPVSKENADVTIAMYLLFTGENFYVVQSSGGVFILQDADVMAINPTTFP